MQYHLVSDLTGIAIQFTFFAGIIFPTIYGAVLRYRWWETVPGRAVFAFGPCVSGALLRSVLILWGVRVVSVSPGGTQKQNAIEWVLSWLALICVFGAGIVLAVLTWEAIRITMAQREPPPSSWVNRMLLLRDKRTVLSEFRWPKRK